METCTVLAIFLAIVALVTIVLLVKCKKENPKFMMRHRAPLMLGRNGRVVSPVKEKFSDQYTMDVPINTNDPIFMTSVPDEPSNPWIGSTSGY